MAALVCLCLLFSFHTHNSSIAIVPSPSIIHMFSPFAIFFAIVFPAFFVPCSLNIWIWLDRRQWITSVPNSDKRARATIVQVWTLLLLLMFVYTTTVPNRGAILKNWRTISFCEVHLWRVWRTASVQISILFVVPLVCTWRGNKEDALAKYIFVYSDRIDVYMGIYVEICIINIITRLHTNKERLRTLLIL